VASRLPDRIAVVGVFYRHLPHQGDPLWRAIPPRDGRWQRGDVVDGLYLADEPDTAWAEWLCGRSGADQTFVARTAVP
jgi:hypothetical protein